MFSIDGITVTRRLETTIRTSARLPALIKYYTDRLQWDTRTFHAVDWETFGSVYPKMQKRRNFVTKFGFYHLPTGERLHRRQSCYDDRCPTCQCPDEDDDHLLHCPTPARQALLQDTLPKLLLLFNKWHVKCCFAMHSTFS